MVQVPAERSFTSMVPLWVDPSDAPLRVISHSKGAQVRDSAPNGFGAAGMDATVGLRLPLISLSMSSGAAAAFSFLVVLGSGGKIDPVPVLSPPCLPNRV